MGVGYSEQHTPSTSRKEMGSKQGLRTLLECLQRRGCDSDMGEGEGLAWMKQRLHPQGSLISRQVL